MRALGRWLIDVTNDASMQTGVGRIIDETGRIDVLAFPATDAGTPQRLCAEPTGSRTGGRATPRRARSVTASSL